MRIDFREERKWKIAVARVAAYAHTASVIDKPEELETCRKRFDVLAHSEE